MKKKNFASVFAAVVVAFALNSNAFAYTSAYGGVDAGGKTFGVMRGAKRYDKLVCRDEKNPSDKFETPTPLKKSGVTVRITCPGRSWSVYAVRDNGRYTRLVSGKW